MTSADAGRRTHSGNNSHMLSEVVFFCFLTSDYAESFSLSLLWNLLGEWKLNFLHLTRECFRSWRKCGRRTLQGCWVGRWIPQWRKCLDPDASFSTHLCRTNSMFTDSTSLLVPSRKHKPLWMYFTCFGNHTAFVGEATTRPSPIPVTVPAPASHSFSRMAHP